MAKFSWHEGEVPEALQIKQVYGLIFSNDGRLLLRTEKKDGKIKYSLAGGRPEKFDSGIEDTIRRELIEEVNIIITTPLIVGYQCVDEENGSELFAQVRMVALIDSVGKIQPDPDTGMTYGRFLVSPIKAAELLNWGDVGYAQIKSAMDLAVNVLGISKFDNVEEYI